MILKLSKIMNFVIYRGKESELPLIEIVSHINNYLELEKVRFQEALDVNFEISGNLEGVYLAPLILSSFVENAVKHGAPDEDGKVRIDISLEVISKEIVKFSIRNKKDTSSRKVEKEHTGLGLINATKTLDLQYGESYDLAVEDSGDHFEVKLQIACGK